VNRPTLRPPVSQIVVVLPLVNSRAPLSLMHHRARRFDLDPG
jgi:hypothetical protein